MTSIGIVTCLDLPEPDLDEKPLVAALGEAGMRPERLAWDDPAADPADFDLCVLRSCWNYYQDPDAFLKWVDRAAATSRLLNPVDIVRWNIHKRYLEALKRAGVPIIPTEWVDRGKSVRLADVMRAHGWDEVVVKPAISAASYRTRRFALDDIADGQSFLEGLARDGDTMIQRYMSSVEEAGERAIVWIDGELTHTVIKSPRFDDDHERVSRANEITSEDRVIAQRALACVKADLLYARVDVVRDGDRLVVSELELMEPSLFLIHHPPALTRLVRAIARRSRGA